MNRIATLAMAASLSFAACAHDDATPDPKTPLGATELQTTAATQPRTDPMSGTTSSTTSRDTRGAVDTGSAQPTTMVPAAANPPSTAPAPMPAVDTASPSRPDADNTRVNTRDRSGANVTPMDQGNNATDLKITQTIRKSVMADDTLSFMAKNVKIITMGSKVVLRGPVKNAQERASIEAKARATAGVTDVDDQLEVKQ